MKAEGRAPAVTPGARPRYPRGAMPDTSDAIPPIAGAATATARDLARAIALLPLFRRRWLFLGGAVALVAAFAALNQGQQLAGLMPFIVFTLLFQAVMFLGPRVLGARTVAKMAERTVHYRADADELTIASGGTTVTRRWELISRFVETDDAFLLWVGPSAVQLVPKRAFGAAEIAWLRATLAAKVHPAAAAARRGRSRALRLALLWAALVAAFLAAWQLLQPGRP